MKTLKIIGIIAGSLIVAYFFILLVFGAFYLAGFRTYRLPTHSMQPTIQQDEMLFGRVSESYREHIQRFDLAIFNAPTPPSDLFVKRVIGLPREHIIIDASGVSIDGHHISLPASVSTAGLGIKPCDMIIPDDAVFVLGDNTPNSLDSRYFGPVQKKNIIGQLLFKQ